MKHIENWEQAFEYVNRLGIANHSMPIGWRQQQLMVNVQRLEDCAGSYPYDVRYIRNPGYGTFIVSGTPRMRGGEASIGAAGPHDDK